MIIRITANYPHDQVCALLRFAAKSIGVNHIGLIVKVKNSRHAGRGTAYPWVWNKDSSRFGATRMVTIGVGAPHKFPHSRRRSRIDLTFSDWSEFLVWIAAHEFRHIKDFDEGIRPRENFAYGDAFITLQEYRKIQRTRIS